MITFTLRSLSLYGKKVTNSLRASEQALSKHCSCPPGQSCSVEISELPGRRFEVIVTRPGPILERHDWSVMTSKIAGKYRRLFERRSHMDRIRDAVARMVGAPLHKPAVPLELPADQRNIVLIDTSLFRRLSNAIIGCQVCSPFAITPVSRILDHFKRPSVPETYYMMERAARCPRCSRPVTEETLVETNVE